MKRVVIARTTRQGKMYLRGIGQDGKTTEWSPLLKLSIIIELELPLQESVSNYDGENLSELIRDVMESTGTATLTIEEY